MSMCPSCERYTDEEDKQQEKAASKGGLFYRILDLAIDASVCGSVRFEFGSDGLHDFSLNSSIGL